jgi:ATP-dependent DNA ligase
VSFPIEPPVEPMLAKLAEELPPAGAFLYEPKWDGFRAIVFRSGSELLIQSLTRAAIYGRSIATSRSSTTRCSPDCRIDR